MSDVIGRVLNGYVIVREIDPDEIVPGMLLFDNCPDKWEDKEVPVSVVSVDHTSGMFYGTLEVLRLVMATRVPGGTFSKKGWLLAIEYTDEACMWCGEIVHDVDEHEQVCGA